VGKITEIFKLNLEAFILTIGLVSGYKIYYWGLDLFGV
jgi:predicted cation transporter